MSESSKMGLFGSKDENKESKKENSKEDSPDRYAPYCMDDSSEAYDTEALSMMDINDIIGVQAEPMAESTLESEIAALSQIITDSKVDGTLDDTTALQVDDSFDELKDADDTNIVSDNTSINNGLSQMVSRQSKETSDNQVIDKVNSEKQCDSSKIELDSSTVTQDKSNELSMVDRNTIVGDKVCEKTMDNVSGDEAKSSTSSETISKDIDKMENISNLGGSLKLIGDAYTSEDSQEGSSNDADPKEDGPANSVAEEPSNAEERILEETSHTPDNIDKESKIPATEPILETIEKPIVSEKEDEEEKQEQTAKGEQEMQEPKSSIPIDMNNEAKVDSTEDTCKTEKESTIQEQDIKTEEMEIEISKELEPSIEMDKIESMECETETTTQDVPIECPASPSVDKVEEKEQVNADVPSPNENFNESVIIADGKDIPNTEDQLHNPKEAINITDSSETMKADLDVPGELHGNESEQLKESSSCTLVDAAIEDLPKKPVEAEVQDAPDAATTDEEPPNIQENEDKESSSLPVGSVTVLSTTDMSLKADSSPETNSESEKQNDIVSEVADHDKNETQPEQIGIEKQTSELSDVCADSKILENEESPICNAKNAEEDVSKDNTLLIPEEVETSQTIVKPIDESLEEAPVTITTVIEEKKPAVQEPEEPEEVLPSAVEECNQDTEGPNEESIVPEKHEKETTPSEITDVLNEGKNIFNSLTTEDKKIIGEDMEEEAIEDEMNLTYEMEEPESHINTAEEMENVPESEKMNKASDRIGDDKTEITEPFEEPSIVVIEDKKPMNDVNDKIKEPVIEDVKEPSKEVANEKLDLQEMCKEEASSLDTNAVYDIPITIESKEEQDSKENSQTTAETEAHNDTLVVAETEADNDTLVVAETEADNDTLVVAETAVSDSELVSQEECQIKTNIIDSIIENKNCVEDLTNIIINESEVVNEIQDMLEESLEPQVETLAENLPQVSEVISEKPIEELEEIEEPALTENVDSLDALLDLNTICENEESLSKLANAVEEVQDQEPFTKIVPIDELLQDPNPSMEVEEEQSNMSDVISSCLTNIDDKTVQEDDKEKVGDQEKGKSPVPEISEAIIMDEDALIKIVNKEIDEADVSKSPETDTELPINDLEMDFMGETVESVDLEESDSKTDLVSDVLVQDEEQTETVDDIPADVETSQPSSEISELESAVKFLQESEEQALDSPLVLSPKMVENVNDESKQTDTSSLFVADEDIGEDTSELVAELQDVASDSISISEAEIISEAAKLENERKLAEQVKIISSPMPEADSETSELAIEKENTVIPEFETTVEDKFEPIETQAVVNTLKDPVPVLPSLSPRVLKKSEKIPKVSILEERLKEPPKIEIPINDVTKLPMSPTTIKDSLLIQKDAKIMAYQKMMDSPKSSEKYEPKITDTPRKDSADKHEFENVGSPRIILKIAKSAIADCSEPRSPKSPKIRSATNSPNPEDSPGQKLGKIKLKLSRGGHPSIISNENVEDSLPWHSEGTASLSPIGMKIKFSKTGDASIVSSEKHEGMDDVKRTESPIGMKIKLSKSGDASIIQEPKDVTKHKEKLDIMQGSPKRTESPIGMKIKLSKSGDASIIQPEKQEFLDDQKDVMKPKELCFDSPKRTDSPIGMKIKLSKTGDASIVSPDTGEEQKETAMIKEKSDFSSEHPKRTDSPIGMKIKLAKTKGGASIISMENTEEQKEKLELPDTPKRTESPLGMKIKLSRTGDASIIHSEVSEDNRPDTKEKAEAIADLRVSKLADAPLTEKESAEKPDATPDFSTKVESPLGMKIKLSKFGDPSIVQPTEKHEQIDEQRTRESLQDTPKRTDSPLGMKIKLSKTGDASIIQSDVPEEATSSKTSDPSLGMKIKLLKSGDASIVDPEKKEKSQRRRDTESPLEMKIKLSKTGHPTIVSCDTHNEGAYKSKDASESPQNFSHRYKESMAHKEPALKILKTAHSTILQSNRSELTIEPVQSQSKKLENAMDASPKRKEITISPIESKKSKLETQLSHILPEVTIQPVMSRDQKQMLFDPKTSLISRQQMNVISQEISITQVRHSKTPESKVPEKLKGILSKNLSDSPLGSDCEIIEHRPELIIVNENSNSSQDVMIIEEVPPVRTPDFKASKRRGRPRRGGASHLLAHAAPQVLMTNDQIAVEPIRQPAAQPGQRENERPKRTCRSQKSYAPPKRGRGRGRGKRKLDAVDVQPTKRAKLDQDLSAIEASTMAVITLDATSTQQDSLEQSELYKALQQPPADSNLDKHTAKTIPDTKIESVSSEATESLQLEDAILPESDFAKAMPKPSSVWDGKDKDKKSENATEKGLKTMTKPGQSNWLTPPSKKQSETGTKLESVSTVQVIDEETRMSAESNSRSQTPARNISVPASDNIVNEESQGSVLSTATTESEKVKVKNRRMEINFDPDEGPFTVDKIAEYEWPLDRKGETFMIQEQISQYLGVKSFKRKYPDLKRRMVDMEERNYLRENGLVSEAMCDMGLTAVCSSEVLDVMCSDFPDQYEEYRKHMREKQVREHSKKQKELTAAANAEKNRIDLAEMAVQSALTWNMNLNKARKESRKCSLDLQTFTIHVPKKQQKVEADRKVSHYPVALIPGQYTDYYREYTAAELRYYPLNTVLYGPMRPNERKFDSQSEGSQSDSDSDSSSDDSSSSSSEGTQDTEGSQSTMDDVDIEIVQQKDEIKLKCKMCLKSLNKNSKNEVLIQCGTCNGHVHPSCIDLTLDMVPHIQSYAWQCTDCKTCAQCHDPADEDKMLFCDMCDRGYHIYCVGLRRVPQGRWHCQECAVCASCGSREAGGSNSDRNSVAQWQHEYKKGDKNTRVYVSTLCVPCSKLWRKGRYCPHCSRCHTAPRLDLEANLVHCSACDKYLHLGCVEIKGQVFDRKNYLCDFCVPNRHLVMKPLVSKTLKS